MPPVPLSSSVTVIEFGSIGIVHVVGGAEDAVGPGVDHLIDAAVKWVRSMFSLVVIVNCDLRRWSGW